MHFTTKEQCKFLSARLLTYFALCFRYLTLSLHGYDADFALLLFTLVNFVAAADDNDDKYWNIATKPGTH